MKRLAVISIIMAFLFIFLKEVRAGIDDGLWAYYPFNGNALDATGNGYDGVVYGASLAPNKAGLTDSAYSFDGLNDYIDISAIASESIRSDNTVAMWFKITELPSTGSYFLYSQWHRHYIAITPTGHVLILATVAPTWDDWGTNVYNYDPRFSPNPLSLNEWHHFAITFKAGDHFAFYIDGKLIESKVPQREYGLAFFGSWLTGQFSLGRIRDFGGGPPPSRGYFKGDLDEVRIYNRALTEMEVQVLADFDRDGIMGLVDGYMDGGFEDESGIFSYNFTDENVDGYSFGYIKPGSGPKITVDDAPFPDGLQISASGGGTRQVRVCDLSPPDGRIQLSDNDSIVVSCGSLNMKVLQGPVELLLGDDNVEVIADTGAVILITESDDRQLQVENLSESVDITIVVDGVPIVIGPDEHLQSTAIDILPADPENRINTKKKGKIPVAIFGSSDLDVTQIDPASCYLEEILGVSTKGKAATLMASIKDVDLDGTNDLVLQFEVQEGIFDELTAATVTCELYGGQGTVSGYDAICTVP